MIRISNLFREPLLNRTVNMRTTRRAKIKVRTTSGGFHLFNRTTGANILIDSFDRRLMLWRSLHDIFRTLLHDLMTAKRRVSNEVEVDPKQLSKSKL